VKITRNRYQQGSIRKVPRAKGFAWEYRYYVTEDGSENSKCRPSTGSSTERKLMFAGLWELQFPGIIKNHLRPRWGTWSSPTSAQR
jgi:hypothetical protein